MAGTTTRWLMVGTALYCTLTMAAWLSVIGILAAGVLPAALAGEGARALISVCRVPVFLALWFALYHTFPMLLLQEAAFPKRYGAKALLIDLVDLTNLVVAMTALGIGLVTGFDQKIVTADPDNALRVALTCAALLPIIAGAGNYVVGRPIRLGVGSAIFATAVLMLWIGIDLPLVRLVGTTLLFAILLWYALAVRDRP